MTQPEYQAVIKKGSDVVHRTAFNFEPSSDKFIRNVFNTNPQLVNGDVVDQTALKQGEQYYWLGETSEYAVQRRVQRLIPRT